MISVFNLYFVTYCEYKYPSGTITESELSEQFKHHEGSGQSEIFFQISFNINFILLQVALVCLLSLSAVRSSLLEGDVHEGDDGDHDHVHDHDHEHEHDLSEHHHDEVEDETREGRDGFPR